MPLYLSLEQICHCTCRGTLECLVQRVPVGKSFQETFLTLMLNPSLVIYCGPDNSDLEWVAELLKGSKTFTLENVREFSNFQRSTFVLISVDQYIYFFNLIFNFLVMIANSVLLSILFGFIKCDGRVEFLF